MTSTCLASIDDANAVITSWMSEVESKGGWSGDTGLNAVVGEKGCRQRWSISRNCHVDEISS